MRARKQTLASVVVGLAATLVSTPATAQAVYDLGDFPFMFSGGTTDVRATLQTSMTGTFTSEGAIENFFNSATYSVVLNMGGTTILDLNNSNATWDLQFSGGAGGATATLTATATEITLDFSTPNEITSAVLILGLPANPGIAQYRQSNNVSDFNFVNVDLDAVSSATANVPYNAPFIFPAVGVPVPAMPGAGVLLSALALLASGVFMRRRWPDTT